MQMPITTRRFRAIIWAYYSHNGRKMPWRRTRDPYRIVVSEIMLQQTQVSRVLKFYPNFIKRFPTFQALAHARTADVLRVWQGLGYNRRALALQRLSRIVLEKFNGKLPHEREALVSLSGIGEATAGSIRAFAWNEPEIFIETNIRRVFIHFFFPRQSKVTDAALARYIKCALPRADSREWYWALMDYGAMLGAAAATKSGTVNPNQRSAHYKKQSPFSGSDRELRGKVLRFLTQRRKISFRALAKEVKAPVRKVRAIAATLVKEGFINIKQ